MAISFNGTATCLLLQPSEDPKFRALYLWTFHCPYLECHVSLMMHTDVNKYTRPYAHNPSQISQSSLSKELKSRRKSIVPHLISNEHG